MIISEIFQCKYRQKSKNKSILNKKHYQNTCFLTFGPLWKSPEKGCSTRKLAACRAVSLRVGVVVSLRSEQPQAYDLMSVIHVVYSLLKGLGILALKSASATVKSKGVVIFMFLRRPSTSATGWPIASTTEASSVKRLLKGCS